MAINTYNKQLTNIFFRNKQKIQSESYASIWIIGNKFDFLKILTDKYVDFLDKVIWFIFSNSFHYTVCKNYVKYGRRFLNVIDYRKKFPVK